MQNIEKLLRIHIRIHVQLTKTNVGLSMGGGGGAHVVGEGHPDKGGATFGRKIRWSPTPIVGGADT